tara:strand:+ start:93511 stop:94062 length:552 start_codon:yes stop_codon:yes gene_type:complete
MLNTKTNQFRLFQLMRKYFIIPLLPLILVACKEINDIDDQHHDNFEKRTVAMSTLDSLESGVSYLSVSSQLYSLSEHKAHNFTITASIRNISLTDTMYITKAKYLDTNAKPLHTYFNQPIFVAPLETLEIVIDEVYHDKSTGASFIFDWKIKPKSKEPVFEGIMISTYGNQGLSFTTQGQRID